MRTIIVRFEIEDNDVIEQGLFNSVQCASFKEFSKLPNNTELYITDAVFRQLIKAQKVAKKAVNDYIYKQSLKLKQ